MTNADENRLKKAVQRLGILRVSRVSHVSENTILRAIAGLPLHKSTATLLKNSLTELERDTAELEQHPPPQAA